MPRQLYVYILSSRTRRLYVGVTNDLYRRLSEHRRAVHSFAARYYMTRLVHFEVYDRPVTAIGREKEIKAWRREKKLRLVSAGNPAWDDLSDGWPVIPDPHRTSGDPSLRSG